MTEKVKIVEVGPRDGLQNEKKTLTVEERVRFIQNLVDAGVRCLEGGSFVSPKAIPQMQNSDLVWTAVQNFEADISFLVPNLKGFEKAKEVGVRSIAVFTATSETFNQKNIRMSVEDSLKVQREVVKLALAEGMRVRGYISTVFGCPYEGVQKPEQGLYLAQELFKMGCAEVSLGDTIGVAKPEQVAAVFKLLLNECDVNLLAGHFHDTEGRALENIKASLDLGIRIFDSSVGGIGGCPYANGATGNVDSEKVNRFLEKEGFKTGIDSDRLNAVGVQLRVKLGILDTFKESR